MEMYIAVRQAIVNCTLHGHGFAGVALCLWGKYLKERNIYTVNQQNEWRDHFQIISTNFGHKCPCIHHSVIKQNTKSPRFTSNNWNEKQAKKKQRKDWKRDTSSPWGTSIISEWKQKKIISFLMQPGIPGTTLKTLTLDIITLINVPTWSSNLQRNI